MLLLLLILHILSLILIITCYTLILLPDLLHIFCNIRCIDTIWSHWLRVSCSCLSLRTIIIAVHFNKSSLLFLSLFFMIIFYHWDTLVQKIVIHLLIAILNLIILIVLNKWLILTMLVKKLLLFFIENLLLLSHLKFYLIILKLIWIISILALAWN